MDKTVYLYTDGACKGNPGAGGWGVLLRYGTHEKELFGGEAETTNNRMEQRPCRTSGKRKSGRIGQPRGGAVFMTRLRIQTGLSSETASKAV